MAWVNLKHLSQRCRNADTNINIFHIDLYTVHNMYIYIYASKLNNVYCWDHPNGWLSKRPEQLIFGDCFYCSGSHRMDIYIYIYYMHDLYTHTHMHIRTHIDRHMIYRKPIPLNYDYSYYIDNIYIHRDYISCMCPVCLYANIDTDCPP